MCQALCQGLREHDCIVPLTALGYNYHPFLLYFSVKSSDWKFTTVMTMPRYLPEDDLTDKTV